MGFYEFLHSTVLEGQYLRKSNICVLWDLIDKLANSNMYENAGNASILGCASTNILRVDILRKAGHFRYDKMALQSIFDRDGSRIISPAGMTPTGCVTSDH